MFCLISFQGTEMFMARTIRAGGPLGRAGHPAWYEKMPELSQKAHMYRKVFPDRLTRFQNSPSSPNYHMVDIGAAPNEKLVIPRDFPRNGEAPPGEKLVIPREIPRNGEAPMADLDENFVPIEDGLFVNGL
jgi:hypothetical protein